MRPSPAATFSSTCERLTHARGPKRCGVSGPSLFAVPAFRAVSCLPRRARLLGGPGCLVCPSRRFGPFAVSPACRLARGAVLQAPCCLSCVPSRPRRNASGPSLSLSRGWVYVRSAMWLCTDQSCPPVTNIARNSPPHISDFEIRPLELQRLCAISKNDRVKLRAKLIWRSPRFPPRAPWPGPSPPVLATPVAMGVLQH